MTVQTIMDYARLAEPVYRWEPDFDPDLPQFAGIRALTYDGIETDKGKTQAFAYIGFPKVPEGETVPGIVLVHGGGGHAYLPWVDMWRKRGYAAIAMDTTGFYPEGRNAGSLEEATAQYVHGMHDGFVREGYVDTPTNDGMLNDEAPLYEQWMTHAVSQVICAHNVLRSFPQVDRSKIGITGISWGGVITALVMPFDPRFAFAVPVYGSAYLDRALTGFGDKLKSAGNIRNFRAEDYYDSVRMPTLWLAWDDDNNFTVTSNSLSYRATVVHNPKTALALTNGMLHSHVNGWAPAIIMAYADSIVKGKTGLVGFTEQPAGRNPMVRLNIPTGARVLRAMAYWIDEPMSYTKRPKYGFAAATFMKQDWQKLDAEVNGNILTAKLPENAAGYYLAVEADVEGAPCVTSSEYIAL